MRRVPELDALRGLAALSIACYHLWFPKWMYGWTRVDLFFLLSGYLVTDLILRRSWSPGFLRTFYARRLLRIGPPYFVALAALVGSRVLVEHRTSLDGWPYYLTFTQNVPSYWNGRVPEFNPHFFHTWSLALDVRFYLVWPLVLIAAGRRWLVPLALAMIASAPVARSLGVSEFILPGRCDGFGWGALLATALSGRHAGPPASALLRGAFAAFSAIGSAIVATGLWRHWGSLTDRAVPWPGLSIFACDMAYAGLIGLVVCHSGHRALGLLRGRALRHLGSISYSLYLLHPLVFMGVEIAAGRIGIARGPALELAMLAASLAAAQLMWMALERPAARLQSAFPYEASSGDGRPRRDPVAPAAPPRSVWAASRWASAIQKAPTARGTGPRWMLRTSRSSGPGSG